MKKEIVKVNSVIDTRVVAMLVQTASKFSSTVKIGIEEKLVNGKSIMGIIALGDIEGKEITVIVDGNDENQAINEINELLSK